MGRQAYPIIGGLIGAGVAFFATGGAATFQGYAAGFALGSTVGGIAGSYIDPLVLQGNTVGDNKVQVAAEGGARAIVFGRGCVTATCIVARGNRKVVKKKQSNGGKGSSGSTSNEFVYWTFAIGIAEAMPGSSICRIWQDEKLVYDVLADGAVSNDDNVAFGKKFRYYDGNETQLPDSDLQVFLGADTPYFRGTAYVVFPNFDLTQTAERIPVFRFELLNGVVGIVDEIETLSWVVTGPTGSTISDQSVTLTGNPDTLLNVDLFFTGHMQCRHYASVLSVLGGTGRFITTVGDSDAASGESGTNVYRLTISDPPQTYYVNYKHEAPGGLVLFDLDGSSDYKLSVQVAGNATIRYYADPIDGISSAFEFGTARAEITGVVTAGDDTIALGGVVETLATRAGLLADQVDVTALDDQIAGVVIQDTSTGADAINACVAAFFADPCEAEGVIKWVKRGADVVRTLTVDDLTEDPESTSRANVIEYPAKLNFIYQSPATGYETTKATSTRYSQQADSSGEGSVTVPVTFYGSDEPAQIAAKLHKVMWTEAEGSFDWVVGNHCIDLLPTDCVGLFLRGIAVRARIMAIAFDDLTGPIKLTMVKDRQSSYTSAVTAIPLPSATPPLPTTMSKTVLGVLDIPALTDSDDSLLYYAAMSGETGTWQGAELQRSLDAGANWLAVTQATTDVTMGRLTVAMTAADAAYTDTTNSVSVQLFDDANELVAFSDTTFLQEQGAIAVQLGDGTWEVMQYRDCDHVGDGFYTLSYLQRGRLNTVAGAHVVTALFVLLDANMLRIPAQSAWLAGVLQQRGVSFGSSAEDADIVSITYAGRSQLEWSPASASAEYDGSLVYAHDIVPRHRFGTEVAPVASINFIGYRIVCSDGTHSVTTDLAAATTGVHIDVSSLGTVTGVTIAGLNNITGPGQVLSLVPTTVTAGSLTPTAIVNAGGST